MMRKITTSYLIFFAFITAMAGCTSANLPRISYDYPFAEHGDNQINSGQTKLLIYNSSHPLLFPWTGKMNVHLNGKGVAQLDIYEHIQLIVPRGQYVVELLHYDAVVFRSTHNIELTTPKAYLEVYATIFSNEARIVQELPEGLAEQLKPARAIRPNEKIE